jgi:hypothetical protein
MKHLIEGGSFEIQYIKATYDMVHKFHGDEKFLVCSRSIMCTTITELNEGGRRMHSTISDCVLKIILNL